MNSLEKIKEKALKNIEESTISYEIFNLKNIPKTRKSFITDVLEKLKNRRYYPDLTIFWINSSKAIEEARFNLEKFLYFEEHSEINIDETLCLINDYLPQILLVYLSFNSFFCSIGDKYTWMEIKQKKTFITFERTFYNAIKIAFLYHRFNFYPDLVKKILYLLLGLKLERCIYSLESCTKVYHIEDDIPREESMGHQLYLKVSSQIISEFKTIQWGKRSPLVLGKYRYFHSSKKSKKIKKDYEYFAKSLFELPEDLFRMIVLMIELKDEHLQKWELNY